MPNFATFTKTLQGLALDNKLAFAGSVLDLTNLAAGSGIWPEGTDASTLTALVAEQTRAAVGEPVARGDGSFEVHGVLSNIGLAAGFDWQECGVFAHDPDLGEILYMVTHVVDPMQADYIPAEGGNNLVEMDFTFLMRSAAGVQVRAVLEDTLVIATKRDVENHARFARLTALTGGVAGALDSIPWGECKAKELAVVETSPGVLTFYRFDKDSLADEAVPEVITPDSAEANPGRWVLARPETALAVLGATSAATAGAYMLRDSAGRAKVAAPLADDDIARKADINAATPAGTVAFFARSSSPEGWLKCNGAAVGRATYAGLFAAIGTSFGVGDGSTTFKLPDLRGEFVRGWDDGRGADSGRVFGSAQADAFRAHNHNPQIYAHWEGGPGGWSLDRDNQSSNWQGISSSTVGGVETRPRNMALLACIKY
ncbi:phage tail protein [Desulfocurvibacter africanus]|uniref:Tail Collar domain protein n=1 Tax=Desulfocurvibacter africanus subsp. africanus str. Walvis Bay TaxID=690850 RepID=F3YY59_DESAF|nr:phage tail protein [Desulfocurvibacter africanus]EGJ51835.1 Tail Collar domain protein [Desulfocurvibacter africanus subsp. africanus str. Walvis Bay]